MFSSFFARRAGPWARLGILFALGWASSASAQLGHVVRWQKISATAGGFDATLEEMDQFGRSIVNLGDLDGDGVTDLLVGAHTDDDGGLDKGSVYILFLNANGSVKHWQKISDLEGNFAGRLRRGDQFGRAAAKLGDLDGDGVTEVAVSANYDDDGGTNKGAVYVLFLNTDGTVKQSTKISSTQGGLPVSLNIHDEFGRSLTALGDMDGDGVTELLVGTPEDDESGTNTGAMHVLFLNADGTVKNYKRISKYSSGLALKPGDWFGFCSANIGDFDGDGVVDVAVGSVLDDDGGVNQGSLWILFLRADGSVKSAREIDELEGNFTQLDDIDQFGTSVANVGDLDGDGVVDLAVGAVKDDDGGTPGDPDADVGAVYVLFMNRDASVKSFVKLSDLTGLPFSLDQWDWFGSALAPLGGSPGDGLFNLAIGSRNDDDAGGNFGAIYLVQLNDGTAPFASFTATPTIGVPPLTVSFNDTSTGIVTGWVWNLGEGPQTTQRNPSKTYTALGAYDVQLTTRGPKGTDSQMERGLIQVVPGLAAFDATPRTGPCPLQVVFDDRSLGNITSWTWDFGDGSGSNVPNPVHLYAACGSYTVTLTASGPSGSFTHTENGFVTAAVNPPDAQFVLAPASGPAPLDVQFSDATTGQVTSWAWDFGDGQTSNEASPLHRYDAEGQYTVALKATGPAGSDVSTQSGCVTVTPPPPTTYFDATPTLGPEPLTVTFSDLTTGTASAWSWDFGDGTTSSEHVPVHTYAAAGLYTVTLTATGPGGSDTRTRDDLITVEAVLPNAAFVAAPTSGTTPLTVQFTDASTNTVTSWLWSFGDGATSSARNPQHVYFVPGAYTVSLTATGQAGSDVESKPDFVTVQFGALAADFTATPTSGAAPLTVQFTNATSGLATSWNWSFGDGASSSAQNPAHVYAAPGSYSVSLTVNGPLGADAETKPGFVSVQPPAPVAAFSATPSSGMAPLTVQFTDATSGAVTAWAWDFGDGASSNTASPSHVYAAGGSYTVALTASGPGGSDGEVKPACVTVTSAPVVADFMPSTREGFAPLQVTFTDQSTGPVTARTWTFDDGTTSTEEDPVHVFALPDTYTVTLQISGPGGATSLKRRTIVANEAPVFADGSFELQTPGLAPSAPWTVYNGSSIVVRPTSVASDQGFPRAGAHWLDIGAEGSSNAHPPSNPRGLGTGPAGACGVQQDFLFPVATPHLVFDAAFLLNGTQDTAGKNDFMSVDLTDGVSVWNVFYADSFSEFALVSSANGLAMTEPVSVHVDLRTLFPDATETTVLSLRASVGNGGGAVAPSRGYVDAFRLLPSATATFRNGHGVNPSFYTCSAPIVGGEWGLDLDSSGRPDARLAVITARTLPLSGFPAPGGELLIVGTKLFQLSLPVTGGVDHFAMPVPSDAALIGFSSSTQATLFGRGLVRGNAYDLRLGY